MRSRPTEDGDALSLLFRILRRLRERDGSRLPTCTELVVVYLGLQPGYTAGMAQLREVLHLKQSRASRLCAALQRAGWIQLVCDLTDRRRSLVRLTPRGRRMIQAQ